MANCPRCGTALKEDYGMCQCPSCGAFCFVDMDGNASVQDSGQKEDSSPAINARDVSVSRSAVSEDHRETPPSGGAAAPSDFSDPIEGLIDTGSRDLEPTAETPAEHDWNAPSPQASPEDSATDSANDFLAFEPFGETPSGSHEHEPADFHSSGHEPVDLRENSDPESFEPIDMSPQAPKPKPSPSFGPANDPLNLNGFANSEVSSAKDGPLLFRVLISGIDTREIRESIREVFEDPRFAWDSNEIFSKISKGILVIDDLSPVKASILITRIKRLPVQIRWEQYAITQGPS